MRTKMLLITIILLLGTFALSALETSPGWSYGFELGVARGDNAGSRENLAPIGRGHVQLDLFPFLFTRIGVGYTRLHASQTYTSNTLNADYRFILNAMAARKYSPYIYVGVGGSLDLGYDDADIIPMLPFGVGLQTRLKPGKNLDINLGYVLSNSDKLDDGLGTNTSNRFTGRKQDGYFSLTAGLNFYNPGPQREKIATTPTPVVELRPAPVAPPVSTPVARPVTPPVTPVAQPPVDLRTMDSDGDGLSDYDEINVYRTDPNNPDTDGDGLSDYDEVMRYRTDPLKADTDGDGLSDYAEVMQYRTDPLVMDTDGGSVNDGDEVAAGTDPLDPRDDVLDLHEGATFTLEGILFDTASANILPASLPNLENVYIALEANPDVKVLITGHTDSVGADDSNMRLSQSRADAVRNWLINRGIAADRMRAIGRGETEPRSTNDTPEGRTQNRRIEFSIE